jgi:hypothetical protein
MGQFASAVWVPLAGMMETMQQMVLLGIGRKSMR